LNKRILPVVIGICIVLAVALVLVLILGRQPAQATVYKIGITQIVTHPALDRCRQGFIEGRRICRRGKRLLYFEER
jgi:ABC-type uncharacterized transport system substrate-binding protein